MFGANPSKKDIDPYSDYRHLQIRGTLLRPSKVKADEIELTFLPSHELNEHNRKHHKPNIVGSLQLYRKRLTGLISMPSDALPLVLQMLIAAQFRYVVLSGEKFRHQHAAIRTYRFERAVDEDDLPADV